MSCKHFDCICYSPNTDSCDYLLIFGKRRGIPGDECHLCLKRFDEEHRPIIQGASPRYINHKLIAKINKAYDPNKTLSAIAREAGANKDLVVKWMKKTHPEYTNYGTNNTTNLR